MDLLRNFRATMAARDGPASLPTLSVRQPIAQLAAVGWLQAIVCARPTWYRGPLVIHAAAEPVDTKWHGLALHALCTVLGDHYAYECPSAAALGMVDVVGCVALERARTDDPLHPIDDRDDAFARGSTGYVWHLQSARKFHVPCRLVGPVIGDDGANPPIGLDWIWRWTPPLPLMHQHDRKNLQAILDLQF